MIKQITKQVTPIAGVIAGSLAADVVINKALADVIKDKNIRTLIPVGLGIFLLTMKGDFMKSLGSGMIANAGTQFAKSTIPGLSGITESDMDAVFEDISEEIEINELDTLNEFDTLNEDISEDISEDFSTLN
jgi:tetrahydromethanopterin S-methyltransferase subunit A